MIHRRTFLKATGVSLALPFLESMSSFGGEATSEPPRRMVLICTALGLHPWSLWPKIPGPKYESTEYLDLLKEHRKDFTLFSGLSHEGQSGRQPHNCEMTWLTAARGPGLDGFRNTISLDQYVAGKLGSVTRFPSVVLGSNSPQSQAYTGSGVMIPAETSPARLFARLFLKGKPSEVEQQKRKLNDGKSILDQLNSQKNNIGRFASSTDNQLLEEYFESVRKAEKEIAAAQGWMDKPKPVVQAKPPTDIRDRRDLIGRSRLLLNMIPLILQTDSSRVVSVMIQDHQVVPQVAGVTGEHHNLSHHGQDKSKIEQLKKIELQVMRSFGDLLTQLKGSRELGGRLLDRTSVLFGSNLGNANSHETRNLPILLAGGGYKHGSYVAYDRENNKPLCNLFLTMLNTLGMETKAFGQSTGPLSW